MFLGRNLRLFCALIVMATVLTLVLAGYRIWRQRREFTHGKCGSLVPGELFPFEYKSGKIQLTGRKVGKDKEQTFSFDIVSSENR
jgi:hypothetical protein